MNSLLDSSPFDWGIETINTSGGETIPVERASVLIIIGPNGSGKSTALRDIQHTMQGGGGHRRVISTVVPRRNGTVDGYTDWLKSSYPVRTVSGSQHLFTRGGDITLDAARNSWNQGPFMQGANPFLIHLLDTQNRLALTTYAGAINVWENPPQAYIHVLQTDDELARNVSAEVRAAFGFDLVIDWTHGSQVGFRVGQEPTRTAADDRVSAAYAAALRDLPRLDEEGDGVRSFVGTLLAATCGAHPVLLVDEPEAFLHPPQARRIGAALAKSALDKGRQVVMATHSADVVQGAVDTAANVAVLRITRAGDTNHGALLPSTQLRELWSRPQLRSAATVDGLFSRGAVACEADSDARLYEALAHREEGALSGGASDLYFVPSGGKGGIAAIASAYRSLGTPTAVIADLDLLRNRMELHAVLTSLGSDLTRFESEYNTLLSALNSAPPVTPVAAFVLECRRILNRVRRDNALTATSRRDLSQLVEQAADWSQVKRTGIAALRGGARTGADTLLADWQQLGLFLVPVGELEAWWPQGPASSKAEWIAAAIPEVDRPGSMTGAAGFVRQLLQYFAEQT